MTEINTSLYLSSARCLLNHDICLHWKRHIQLSVCGFSNTSLNSEQDGRFSVFKVRYDSAQSSRVPDSLPRLWHFTVGLNLLPLARNSGRSHWFQHYSKYELHSSNFCLHNCLFNTTECSNRNVIKHWLYSAYVTLVSVEIKDYR